MNNLEQAEQQRKDFENYITTSLKPIADEFDKNAQKMMEGLKVLADEFDKNSKRIMEKLSSVNRFPPPEYFDKGYSEEEK